MTTGELPEAQDLAEAMDHDASYLDEDWLDTLRFEMTVGDLTTQITGFAGAGGTWVVLHATGPHGGDAVLKSLRREWSFRSYIRELPPSVGGGAHFDSARLERKLDRLVGDPMLDSVVAVYDDLYRALVERLRQWHPIDEIDWEDERDALVIPFGVRLSGTTRKLEQVRRYGNHSTAAWAADVLTRLQRVDTAAEFQPETVHENPIYVWGAALLDEYFKGDRFEVGVRATADRLSRDPATLEPFMWQGYAVGHLVGGLDITSEIGHFWEALRNELIGAQRAPQRHAVMSVCPATHCGQGAHLRGSSCVRPLLAARAGRPGAARDSDRRARSRGRSLWPPGRRLMPLLVCHARASGGWVLLTGGAIDGPRWAFGGGARTGSR